MVIAVEGGFVRREADDDGEEEQHPVRYLPLGRVYSSTAPCPLPAKKPRAAPAKPPVIVYYRRRRKKPRLQEPVPSSPATPRQLEEDPEPPEGRVSRRKCPLRHELLGLGPAPPALDADELVRRRRQQPRRSGGAESTSAGRQRQPRHSGQKEAASSTGRRWVE